MGRWLLEKDAGLNSDSVCNGSDYFNRNTLNGGHSLFFAYVQNITLALAVNHPILLKKTINQTYPINQKCFLNKRKKKLKLEKK